MITFGCPCGKTLRVKDEFAGKKVRCPDCSSPVKIPAASVLSDADFEPEEDEEWDDEPQDLPKKSKSGKSKSGKSKSKKGKRKSSGGGPSPLGLIGGVLAILLGVASLIGIGLSLANGNLRALRAIIFPFVCIGVGVAWLRGKSYYNN